MSDIWIADVESKMKKFAQHHGIVFKQTARQVAASFEIGCFHALTEFYSKTFTLTPQNLNDNGEYRYLTTPGGNPVNFSFVRLEAADYNYELRQQVRICSHLHADISVTPDLVVIMEGTQVQAEKRNDYASGKRSFFFVESTAVVAAHECKSMSPFPELLVGYIGMLMATHAWLDTQSPAFLVEDAGRHLAPSLFIGGDARGIHLKMIAALEETYPMNVIVGLHTGTWSLLGGRKLKRIERAY